MDKTTLIIGFAVLVGLVAVSIYLSNKTPSQTKVVASSQNRIDKREYIKVAKAPSAPSGEYRNLETWDIKYSPDGMPTKITIHREATRT